MSSARTLSTTELGATRYSHAAATDAWPVQVCITPTPSFSTTQYKLVIDGVRDTPFSQTWHADIRATVALPAGKHCYKVYRDSVLLYSDEVVVQPGEPPIATTKLASELTERRPSGVTQIGDSVDGKARVRFVYAEETHSARQVFAVGDGVNLELQREQGGDFVGEDALRVGNNSIRFRVVPREWTRAEVAAFTKLGWDDSAGERGVLVTWPLSVDIRARVGEGKPEEGAGDGGTDSCGGCGGLGAALVAIVVGVAGLAVAAAVRCEKESVDGDVVQVRTAEADKGTEVRKSDDAGSDVLSHARGMPL